MPQLLQVRSTAAIFVYIYIYIYIYIFFSFFKESFRSLSCAGGAPAGRGDTRQHDLRRVPAHGPQHELAARAGRREADVLLLPDLGLLGAGQCAGGRRALPRRLPRDRRPRHRRHVGPGRPGRGRPVYQRHRRDLVLLDLGGGPEPGPGSGPGRGPGRESKPEPKPGAGAGTRRDVPTASPPRPGTTTWPGTTTRPGTTSVESVYHNKPSLLERLS
ncbi:hypothetical protein F4778DRAFT_204820 [Xylariomycetidae sp. FL2044]|nr:hypothetical protein F4778DRAFT_204820 [Xylariomycetidae sp. FL2044]